MTCSRIELHDHRTGKDFSLVTVRIDRVVQMLVSLGDNVPVNHANIEIVSDADRPI